MTINGITNNNDFKKVDIPEITNVDNVQHQQQQQPQQQQKQLTNINQNFQNENINVDYNNNNISSKNNNNSLAAVVAIDSDGDNNDIINKNNNEENDAADDDDDQQEQNDDETTYSSSSSLPSTNTYQQQNQFQSSISCGQMEFYVQLTFEKPFKGLVYAYKMFRMDKTSLNDQQQQLQQQSSLPPQPQQYYGNYYYPIEILESCTIHGNGESIVYLELSFFSECVEKLLSSSSSSSSSSSQSQQQQQQQQHQSTNETILNNQSSLMNVNGTLPTPTSTIMNNSNNDEVINEGFINSHTINLDGFNFRRALNNDLLYMNDYYHQYYQQQRQQQQQQLKRQHQQQKFGQKQRYKHRNRQHQQKRSEQQQQQQQQQQLLLQINKDDIYQLSLYIQNDPKIEQKFDSKVIVQCSSKVTKNIILEQNSNNNINDFYRRIDDDVNDDYDHQFTNNSTNNDWHQSSNTTIKIQRKSTKQSKTIMPKANLTISTLNDYYYQQQQQKSKQNNTHTANEIDLKNVIESRMDILRGRIPFLKLIESNVELGDDITLIIRSKQLDDYDSRISTCYASDESNTMRYELTNHDGCPVDSSVMTAFKIMQNVGIESKIFYTSFPAFKFPGSQYLNIQCTLLVCEQICPNPLCDQQQEANTIGDGW